MSRHFLKYTLALFILFQSWHGVMAAPVEMVRCGTVMLDAHMADNSHHGASGECKQTQHKQLCVQACAMAHALLFDTAYVFGTALSVHSASVVLPMTGISHRPLIPPPISRT